jgi:hypothetical protein
MTKTLIVAALLSSFAMASFAQASAPMAADGASAPTKHKMKKAHKAHKAASAATDPEKSADKKGGQ